MGAPGLDFETWEVQILVAVVLGEQFPHLADTSTNTGILAQESGGDREKTSGTPGNRCFHRLRCRAESCLCPGSRFSGPKDDLRTCSTDKAHQAAQTPASRPKGHTFQVNDEKGLLLTCVAPELDTNPDTDIFNSCTLAPGRTLDDVMHTFIQAIHFVQNEQAMERAEWYKDQKEESVVKPAQK